MKTSKLHTTGKYVFCAMVCILAGGIAYAQQYYGNSYSGNQTRNVTVGDVLSGRTQTDASSVQSASYEVPTTHSQPPVQVVPTRYETPSTAYPAAYPVRQVNYEEGTGAGESRRAVQPQSVAGPRGDLAEMPKNQILAFSERVTLREGTFQMLTIIDPEKKSLCIYHVNLETGQIELKSARKLEWDLELIYLNSKKPLPNEVQMLLQTSGRR